MSMRKTGFWALPSGFGAMRSLGLMMTCLVVGACVAGTDQGPVSTDDEEDVAEEQQQVVGQCPCTVPCGCFSNSGCGAGQCCKYAEAQCGGVCVAAAECKTVE